MKTKLALAALTAGLACSWASTAQADRIERNPGLTLDAAFAELSVAQTARRMDRQIVRHYRSGYGQYGQYGGRNRMWTHYSPGYDAGYGYGCRNDYYPAPRYRAYFPVHQPYPHHHYRTHVHGGLGIHGPNGSIHIRF